MEKLITLIDNFLKTMFNEIYKYLHTSTKIQIFPGLLMLMLLSDSINRKNNKLNFYIFLYSLKYNSNVKEFNYENIFFLYKFDISQINIYQIIFKFINSENKIEGIHQLNFIFKNIINIEKTEIIRELKLLKNKKDIYFLNYVLTLNFLEQSKIQYSPNGSFIKVENNFYFDFLISNFYHHRTNKKILQFYLDLVKLIKKTKSNSNLSVFIDLLNNKKNTILKPVICIDTEQDDITVYKKLYSIDIREKNNFYMKNIDFYYYFINNHKNIEIPETDCEINYEILINSILLENSINKTRKINFDNIKTITKIFPVDIYNINIRIIKIFDALNTCNSINAKDITKYILDEFNILDYIHNILYKRKKNNIPDEYILYLNTLFKNRDTKIYITLKETILKLLLKLI